MPSFPAGLAPAQPTPDFAHSHDFKPSPNSGAFVISNNTSGGGTMASATFDYGASLFSGPMNFYGTVPTTNMGSIHMGTAADQMGTTMDSHRNQRYLRVSLFGLIQS